MEPMGSSVGPSSDLLGETLSPEVLLSTYQTLCCCRTCTSPTYRK